MAHHYQQQMSITNVPSSASLLMNISSSNIEKLQNPQSLPLKSSMADSAKLLLFYHGDDISGSPIYTVDMRRPLSSTTMNGNSSSFKHFISQTYQNRAKVIFPKQTSSSESINNDDDDADDVDIQSNHDHQAQLILDNVQPNDNGLYWCRVDFRWMRTLISTVELKVFGKFFSLVVWL